MCREEVYKEIEQNLGLIPKYFETIPEESLNTQWDLFKHCLLQEEDNLNPKYAELIDVASAVTRQCIYCTSFHIGIAKLHGATNNEIYEAVHLAQYGHRWNVFLNGALKNQDKFMSEVKKVVHI